MVEEAKDVVAIERTREYRGLYHVLGGALNPMQGIGPDQLRVASLMTRLVRIFISHPGLARTLTGEQRELLASESELAPVVSLVERLQSSEATSLGVAFEAVRDSEHSEVYAAAAGDTLLAATDEDAARADLEGEFAQLELKRVQSEYTQLTVTGVRDERYKRLARRLAELKGAGAVNVPSQI